MKIYEIVLLIHPWNSRKIHDVVKQCTDIINQDQGEVIRVEDWGVRRLDYSKENSSEVRYFFINAVAEKKEITELVDFLQNNEAVIRHMVMAKNGSDTLPLNNTHNSLSEQHSDNRMQVLISKGNATASDISELMHELSILYQMIGGSGLSFEFDQSKQKYNEEVFA